MTQLKPLEVGDTTTLNSRMAVVKKVERLSDRSYMVVLRFRRDGNNVVGFIGPVLHLEPEDVGNYDQAG